MREQKAKAYLKSLLKMPKEISSETLLSPPRSWPPWACVNKTFRQMPRTLRETRSGERHFGYAYLLLMKLGGDGRRAWRLRAEDWFGMSGENGKYDETLDCEYWRGQRGRDRLWLSGC